MLNISGSHYDFAHIAYAVLMELEHRRRAIEDDHFGRDIAGEAHDVLARIRQSYDEIHGNAAYWAEVEKEILRTVVPQYIASAQRMNHLEQTAFEVWREGDLAARGVFALGGLLLAASSSRCPSSRSSKTRSRSGSPPPASSIPT